MRKPSGVETTVRVRRGDGRDHFKYPDLWKERLFEWLVPSLWVLMPIVALVACVWASARS